MADYDFDQGWNKATYDPRNPHAGDESLHVEFYMEAVPDPEGSQKEGRPVWKQVEAIKIFVNKDEITVHAPLYDDSYGNLSDTRRWPRQYAAWKATGHNKPGMMGLPLSKWPQITNPAIVKELEYFKVYTVERLAELPDTEVQRIPGLQQLKNAAKVHMEIARGEAPMHRLNKELESRDAAIDQLKTQNEALLKRLEAVEAESRAKTPKREIA